MSIQQEYFNNVIAKFNTKIQQELATSYTKIIIDTIKEHIALPTPPPQFIEITFDNDEFISKLNLQGRSAYPKRNEFLKVIDIIKQDKQFTGIMFSTNENYDNTVQLKMY